MGFFDPPARRDERERAARTPGVRVLEGSRSADPTRPLLRPDPIGVLDRVPESNAP